ncbi:MAG TPA: hypothetical protein VG408_05315 [Actinomycetota bacterium]|nr:hypothetical protein [Actinomycetota bacterium]
MTAPARTLLDIANTASRSDLESALDHCLRLRLTTFLELGCLLGTARRGVPGAKALRRAVEERNDDKPIPESVLESRLWRPLQAAGGPAPERQYPVHYGGTRYRLDFAFPHAKIAIEAQSFMWHNDRSSWEKDLEKSNALVALGWKLIQVTWDDLDGTRMLSYLQTLLLPQLF